MGDGRGLGKAKAPALGGKMAASTHALAHPAQVAGQFYPDDPARLGAALDAAFAAAPPCPFRAKMVVVPHAGIAYSGRVAAKALRALDAPKRLKRIVILGPNHRVPLDGIALHPAAAWATPLGVSPVAEDAARAIRSLDGVAVDARPFAGEHSLEMALIFVQRLLPGVEIIPALVGAAEPALVEEAVERLWGGPETAICISSDLSHFLSAPAAHGRDDATRAKIERGDWSELQPTDACGYSALRGAIRVAEARGMRATGIAFATSDEAGAPSERVVGYGAFAFEEADVAKLADADRARLLAVAAASLAFAADHAGDAPEIEFGADLSPALSAQRASFVTLERDGLLRGCIGSPAPRTTLARDVSINAAAAGFGDPRFSPLTASELTDLTISISVLSPAAPLALADEDELIAKLHPGRDGLILRERGASALFLPSVWNALPDRRAFVQHLKRKMGRASSHWSESMRAWRFTTESFAAPFAAAKAGAIEGIELRQE
jgi:AmmeMemoRadiSam system protein B/AmmeMemoRadiSam system protein A